MYVLSEKCMFAERCFPNVAKRCQTLEGVFLVVSKPKFASKYSFSNIFKIYNSCGLLHQLLHRSKLNSVKTNQRDW